MPDDLSRSNSLVDLAARIQVEHMAVADALKDSVRHAIAAGEMLIEAKAKVGHGQWLPWLASCGVSERNAQRYMRLARHRDVIEANPTCVSDLGINGALALLTAPRDTGDTLVDRHVDLAEVAADAAFEFLVLATEADERREEDLLEEARAAINVMMELLIRARPLVEMDPERASVLEPMMNAVPDYSEQIAKAAAEYRFALAASVGLTVDEMQQCAADIAKLKQRGRNEHQIARALGPKWFSREPLPGPSPMAAAAKLRDLVVAWLALVECEFAKLSPD
jgi:hypothetical protein